MKKQSFYLLAATKINVTTSVTRAAVFDSAQTTGLDEPIWEYIGSNGFKLEDFQLGVTTAPNDMGIAAGEHNTRISTIK